jgi:DNA modification methylase
MKIELWPLAKIKPYERNPRIHRDAVAAVAKSIEEFGFRQPIVVDKKGVIIVGHARFQAAQQLNLERVPVHVAADLTAAQVKAYRVADNQTGELSDWDLKLLGLELADLRKAEFDLSTLGFPASELARLVAGGDDAGDPDFIPEPPDKPTTARGDLWILGEHRLLCGDSSSAEDVDRLLAGDKVQLVNTDPPYNVKVEPRSNNAIAAGLSSFTATHHQKFDAKRNSKSKPTNRRLRAKDRPLANDFVSDQQFETLLAAWFGNLARVLEPGRAFYIWGGFSNCANYPPAMAAARLYFSQAIIWAKNQPVLTRKDFMTAHEWCFYGWREGAAHKFFGPKNVPDVWELLPATDGACQLGPGLRLTSALGGSIDVLPSKGDRARVVEVKQGVTISGPAAMDLWFVRKLPHQEMVHLTEKPVELAMRAMDYSSKPGEVVLDLFGGSGSTLIAAEMCGRRSRLTELDPLYCDVIVKRWETFTGKKATRERATNGKKNARP